MSRGRYRTRRNRDMITAWVLNDTIEFIKKFKGEESYGWAIERLVLIARNCNPPLQSEVLWSIKDLPE